MPSLFYWELQALLVLSLITKKTIDHIKAAYGIIAMLHSIADRFNFADVELFKKFKVVFFRAADKKIRLWTMNLVSTKVYVLNRVNSASTNH